MHKQGRAPVVQLVMFAVHQHLQCNVKVILYCMLSLLVEVAVSAHSLSYGYRSVQSCVNPALVEFYTCSHVA